MRASTRRLFFGIVAAAMAAGTLPALADSATNWDGAWSGALGRRVLWPITVTVAGDKVVSFVENGVTMEVRYSKVTPEHISFGDKDHYSVSIDRSGAATATAVLRGRHGAGKAMLTRG